LVFGIALDFQNNVGVHGYVAHVATRHVIGCYLCPSNVAATCHDVAPVESARKKQHVATSRDCIPRNKVGHIYLTNFVVLIDVL
jgi:hypothetical protein